MTKFEEIKQLMQAHDWFFDYSDDQRDWRKGFGEKAFIMQKMKQIPMSYIPELLNLVPEKLRDQWFVELQRMADQPPTLNSHPESQEEAY